MTSVIVSKSKVALPKLIFVKICGVLCIHTPWEANPLLGAIIQRSWYSLCYNITITHGCGRPSNRKRLPAYVLVMYILKEQGKPYTFHLSVFRLLLLYIYVFIELLFVSLKLIDNAVYYLYSGLNS